MVYGAVVSVVVGHVTGVVNVVGHKDGSVSTAGEFTTLCYSWSDLYVVIDNLQCVVFINFLAVMVLLIFLLLLLIIYVLMMFVVCLGCYCP